MLIPQLTYCLPFKFVCPSDSQTMLINHENPSYFQKLQWQSHTSISTCQGNDFEMSIVFSIPCYVMVSSYTPLPDWEGGMVEPG